MGSCCSSDIKPRPFDVMPIDKRRELEILEQNARNAKQRQIQAQMHSQTKPQNSREQPKTQTVRTSQQPVRLIGSYASSTSPSTDFTNTGYGYGYSYTYPNYSDNNHHTQSHNNNTHSCHDHHTQSHCHDNHTQSHCHDSHPHTSYDYHTHSNHDCHNTSSSLY